MKIHLLHAVAVYMTFLLLTTSEHNHAAFSCHLLIMRACTVVNDLIFGDLMSASHVEQILIGAIFATMT